MATGKTIALIRWTFVGKVMSLLLHMLSSRNFIYKPSWLIFLIETPWNNLSSVQSLSPVWFFVTSWTAARQTSLSITNSQGLLKLMSIESVMPSNHLILCHPLLLLPSIFPTIRVFSKESVLLISWPKYWSFTSGGQNIDFWEFDIETPTENPNIFRLKK